MKKWLKVLLIVLGSIIVFLGLLTIFIGPIAKTIIENHSKEICHRTVTMDKLRINLFTGGVDIRGFKALEEDDQNEFLTFDDLNVNIDLFALIVKKVKLRHITLEHPVINVMQNGTDFNFSDIIEFYRPEQPDTTPSNWIVDLRKINLVEGSISYSDLQVNSNVRMKKINIDVPRICFGRGNSDMAMQLLFEQGGSLDIKVGYGMDKSDFVVYLTLNEVNLNPARPYLHRFIKHKHLEGNLSANLSVAGNLNHILDLNAKGNVSLYNFGLSTKHHDDIIKLDRMSIDIDTINIANNIYHFEKIALDALQVKFEINEYGNSFASLFDSEDKKTDEVENGTKEKESKKNNKKSVKENLEQIEIEKEDSEKSDDATQFPDIQITHFVMNNCGVDFVDKTLKAGAMELPVSNITVDAHDLRSASQSKASLYAHFGKTGEFICNWDGMLSPYGNQSIELEIKDLQMKELSPYCLHYFAYPISKGVLVYKGKTTLKNRYLDSQNHIDMYNLIIDKKRKNLKPEYKLPLQAAAYVLTDITGRAQLDLPVKGDVSNPKFNIGKIIVKAFFNTILRIAVSPVDMIIQACRANADVFKDLNIDLSQDGAFTSKQYDQFNGISEIMKEKPELSIEVTPSFNLVNYNPAGDASQNALTLEQYEHLKSMILSHFSQYGIGGDRIIFTNEFGKKTPLKDKVLLSFDVRTPGMEDLDGMEAAEEFKAAESKELEN